jgi:hypothetical protein
MGVRIGDFPYTLFIYKSSTANDNLDMLTALRRHMGDPDLGSVTS